jgi:excisionase family DNA binding protein
MNGGSNRMLSVKETAEFLGVSPKLIYNRWSEMGLTAYRVRSLLKFRERDLENWLEKNKAA